MEELGGACAFVRLERPDEVHIQPFKCGRGFGLGLPLLHAILAEETLSGGVGLEQSLDGVDLADGHEAYLSLRAMGSGAGVGDLVADAFKILGDGHAGLILRGWMGGLDRLSGGPGVQRVNRPLPRATR